MLNTYFVFGIPAILAIVFWITWNYFHKQHSDYLRFVLLLTSTFMASFSYQVLRLYFQERARIGYQALSKQLGYPAKILWLPMIVSIVLVIFSFFIILGRIKTFDNKNKNA